MTILITFLLVLFAVCWLAMLAAMAAANECPGFGEAMAVFAMSALGLVAVTLAVYHLNWPNSL